MRVHLFSPDPHLHEMCRQLLHGYSQGSLTSSTSAPSFPLPPADLYLYDFPPANISQFIRGGNGRKNIVLVDRPHIPEVRDEFRFLYSAVLLKPVDAARLQVALLQSFLSDGVVEDDLIRIDRDDMLQSLLKANLKLQEHEQDRGRFLARAVHELRAPLTSLSGYCGLLLAGELDALTQKQQMVISRMRQSVSRLDRIVSAMFDLTAGQNLGSSPTFSTGDCTCCVEQAVHELTPVFQDRRIDLDVQLLPSPGSIRLDRGRIEQVFVNLLDNSCKFTPRGGTVTVRGYPYRCNRLADGNGSSNGRQDVGESPAVTAYNSYRIDISDSGPGIPGDQLHRIFDEFTSYQGGADRSGSGLGLAICQMIIASHNGRIWAESPGTQGASFSVVLPYERNC